MVTLRAPAPASVSGRIAISHWLPVPYRVSGASQIHIDLCSDKREIVIINEMARVASVSLAGTASWSACRLSIVLPSLHPKGKDTNGHTYGFA